MYDLEFRKEHKYRFERVLYSGAGSTFVEAFDETEKRKVGIKILKVAKAELQTARSEATVINRLSSISTHVPVLFSSHYDSELETFYLIMQLIQGGQTLERHISVKLSFLESADIIIKLCHVLIPLHRNKYQHRDLKPQNIMLKGEDIYIIDFNLTARAPFKGEGTVGYQAPEQNRYHSGIGSDSGDIFSLGVILYELLVGEAPRFGIDYVSRGGSAVWDRFVTPSEKDPTIPLEISEVVTKCMKLNPKERYQDAYQLKSALLQAKKMRRP